MSSFRTALGDGYTIERRLPRPGWRPRYRGLRDGATDLIPFDAGDDILGWIGAIFFVLFAVVVLLPLLLFVAEVAAFVAIVIPLLVLGLGFGAVRHSVVVRAGGKYGPVIATREVRGVVASWRAARELRDEAEAGRLRSAAAAQLSV
jgi:hypothetical protein